MSSITGSSTERLIAICKNLNCDKYYSGFGGENYQDIEIFKINCLELLMSEYKRPVYSQIWGNFIPNLSVIDLLFNCGPESSEIIRGN